MDDPLKGYRHETPTARLRWRGDVLEQRWLITDKDCVSNPAYEWRAVERVAHRSAPRRPTHPGALLREDVLPALGLSPEQAAETMGVDVEIVRGILAETAEVTREIAEAIGRLAGNGPNLWLRMQEAHLAAPAGGSNHEPIEAHGVTHNYLPKPQNKGTR